jgi:sodium/potassium-transporting ATPase subunit beta
MAEANINLGGTAIKPVGWDRTGWEAFQYLLYDPDAGTVLTRTPLSWFKITIFYIIYYIFLTGFWIACLLIFFQTLPMPEDGPRWTLDNALIGNNPGVGLRPRNTDARIDSQMFVLEEGDQSRFISEKKGEGDLNADYAERVNIFFGSYNKTVAQGYKEFKPNSLGFCGKFPYGYVGRTVTPCIFFKLNNIWGWKPRAVECGNPEEKGSDGEPKDDCPASLVRHLESPVGKKAGSSNIWIDCNGRNSADAEAVSDGLQYFPASRAIPMDYFPYEGQKNPDPKTAKIGYHSPLVALQVSPKTKGQLVHLECRAYFRGVIHSKKNKLGLVQFEVQVT